MTIFIGLTGSIGSGKSTAADFFKSKGIEIIDADHIAKTLTAPETQALHDIIEHFGASYLTSENTLNRRLLRHYIMNHPQERKWLEDYLHPKIQKEIEKQAKQAQGPYVIIEIPLLLSKDAYPYLKRVLLIESAPENQIKRIMARDACSKSQAEAALKAQPNQTLRRAIADDIIQNDLGLANFHEALMALHEKFLLIL